MQLRGGTGCAPITGQPSFGCWELRHRTVRVPQMTIVSFVCNKEDQSHFLPPGRKPPAAAKVTPEVTLIVALHLESRFLREAAACSLVFFESSLFSQLFYKPLLAGTALHIAF
ncbi:unnamed protein product [Rangifer tarandus platyrhynchus]|uniref:Uncharacterized protein n=1 Tax=Rangifer tarandus platyrhynchus TaxID=3082113 RepID=A0ABN8Y1H4_RANTA|nr:unnamed protein product [Rangifer tarandus platyrhynchus]